MLIEVEEIWEPSLGLSRRLNPGLDAQEMEIKIINEYRLNMLERDHRKMLRKYMTDFLNTDGKSSGGGAAPEAVAEAWTPEKS